ncbi:MAG TPA: hypothetical protein VM008_09160 [Phycisphaerae bacterium]|nr:hypothetical protein [Phycisphaerae bacterium]
MRPLQNILLLVSPLLLSLSACSQAPQQAALGPLYVPSATLTQPHAPAAPAVNAYAVLPESDSLDLWVPRQEKGAWGPYVLQQATSYSIFTYDQQRIASFYGNSYRYRWLAQWGVTVP